MSNIDILSRAQRPLESSKWLGALIVAAIAFNAALCFANTNIAPISNAHVVGAEAAIITAALLACHRTIETKHLLIIVALILYTVALALLRAMISPDDGLNLKISRDFLIPIVFLSLGKSVTDVKVADRIVGITTTLILAFAIFEFFDLDAFLKVFGVTEYYVARGTLDALDPALKWAGGLMASGIRPPEQGRTLLPFLGEHRISSLLLEPIGLGNFGSLVVFWAIARSIMERRLRFWSIAAGVALIILSDTRFDAYFLGIGILVLLINPRVTSPAIAVMPFVIMFGLYVAAASAAAQEFPFLDGLSLQDRLLYSGRVLLDFDIFNWLGIATSRGQTFDAGYAYVISNVGLLGFSLFWLWFMSLGGRNSYFCAFRNANATYFAVLLCVSASPFTIKTAAQLWFLMGALSNAPMRRVGAQPGSEPAKVTFGNA